MQDVMWAPSRWLFRTRRGTRVLAVLCVAVGAWNVIVGAALLTRGEFLEYGEIMGWLRLSVPVAAWTALVLGCCAVALGPWLWRRHPDGPSA